MPVMLVTFSNGTPPVSLVTGVVIGVALANVLVGINKNLEELRREPLLVDLRRRYRDVKQGRDGLLYLLTDEADAVMLRISNIRGTSGLAMLRALIAGETDPERWPTSRRDA